MRPLNLLVLVPWDDYGRAIGQFLQAGTARGAKIDFTKRKLWALGHSMGAVSMWDYLSDVEMPNSG